MRHPQEGMFFGREVAEDSEATKPLHGPNQWPDPVRPLFLPALLMCLPGCADQVHTRHVCWPAAAQVN